MFKTPPPGTGSLGAMTDNHPAQILGVVIDCADPAALAAFYQQAVGGQITFNDGQYAVLEGGPIELLFQRVDGYRPPAWPGDAKHAHLDLKVAALDTAAKALVELGATLPEHQPGGGDWLVLQDPEGHLFCITTGH